MTFLIILLSFAPGMLKEYFNLTLRQTFLSWSLMETIVSFIGLAGVLVLDQFFNKPLLRCNSD